jgi:allantoate deiminase
MTMATHDPVDARAAPSIGQRVMARLDELAAFSDEAGRLTRLYLSPSHSAAAQRLLSWMRQAGLDAGIDAIGNVVGRYPGLRPDAPALIIGSHIDTVRDAGRYDGNLGVLAGLACVEELASRGERLPFAIEVVAFGDEEGVRFPSTLNGSRALAGIFESKVLDQKDRSGITLRDALTSFGCEPLRVASLARRPEQLIGYVEVHIEQGPVLQQEGLPVGIVTAINGATRLSVSVSGQAGHAGTVPMHLRRDPMTAAAQMISYVDERVRMSDAVATVGQIEAFPGAPNVIPGRVAFTVDVRSAKDETRRDIVSGLHAEFERIATSAKVAVEVSTRHEMPAVACDPRLSGQLASAVAEHHVRPFRLSSGAGHDAASFDTVCPLAMLFVRCRDGISHSPEESITLEDADLAVRILIDFVRGLDSGVPAPRGRSV